MDGKNTTAARQVLSYQDGKFSPLEREVARESVWHITLNHRPAGELTCSPWDLEEAALGHLFLRGIIGGGERVLRISLQQQAGHIALELGPWAPPEKWEGPPLSLTPEQVLDLSQQLEDRSHLFHRTGGVHSCALAREGRLLVYKEDVSRRGAVERAAGACLLQGVPMGESLLVFSGRVAGGIVDMAAAMGCGGIVARSAPTDLACRRAREEHMALAGFARGDSFNLYTCPQRFPALGDRSL